MRTKNKPPKSSNPLCREKRMHPTKTQATEALNRFRKLPQCYAKDRLQVYLCQHCAHWHLGHAKAPVPA